MCVEVTGDRGSRVAFLLSMGIAAVLGVDILGGLSRKVLRMEPRNKNDHFNWVVL